eukprot:jgi/Mesen1/6641/ME000034S06095
MFSAVTSGAEVWTPTNPRLGVRIKRKLTSFFSGGGCWGQQQQQQGSSKKMAGGMKPSACVVSLLHPHLMPHQKLGGKLPLCLLRACTESAPSLCWGLI